MGAMERLAWVCLGGAVGSGARYLVSSWALARCHTGIPWGTFFVNVAGSFLIGLILRLATSTDWISPTTQIALTAGVIGGFTTYSAFAYETFARLERGEWLTGGVYVLATVVGCFAAVFLGNAAARAWAGP
jgi:CrcB protein